MNYGDWIQTYTGKAFWPLGTDFGEIDIDDIAHSLGNLCRFNGHSKRFYSIAEHCYHMSFLVSSDLALPALLHDASEAYLCDIPRPIKNAVLFVRDSKLISYKQLERELQYKIEYKYMIVERCKRYDAVLKQFDNIMLATEAEQLMKTPPRPWALTEQLRQIRLYCWEPVQATRRFKKRFDELS